MTGNFIKLLFSLDVHVFDMLVVGGGKFSCQDLKDMSQSLHHLGL